MSTIAAVGDCVGEELRERGLGESDFRVLEVLFGPIPVNTIGPKVFLTPGSISTAVDRLYEKGLVSRADSETDRRVRVVNLTDKGRSLIVCLFSAHAGHLERLAAALTPAERTALIKGLKKLGKKGRGGMP